MQDPQIREKQLRCDHWFVLSNNEYKCAFCNKLKHNDCIIYISKNWIKIF